MSATLEAPVAEAETVEAPTKEVAAPKAPKKAKGASKPKAGKSAKKAKKSPGKAPTAPKAKAKSAPKANKPLSNDDTRRVAKASDGKLNASQVRILRALRDTKNPGGEMTRDDIKEAVGIGRDGKYSQTWLVALWALNDGKHRYINIEEVEGDRKLFHTITKLGKEVLAKAEANAKKEAAAA